MPEHTIGATRGRARVRGGHAEHAGRDRGDALQFLRRSVEAGFSQHRVHELAERHARAARTIDAGGQVHDADRFSFRRDRGVGTRIGRPLADRLHAHRRRRAAVARVLTRQHPLVVP